MLTQAPCSGLDELAVEVGDDGVALLGGVHPAGGGERGGGGGERLDPVFCIGVGSRRRDRPAKLKIILGLNAP